MIVIDIGGRVIRVSDVACTPYDGATPLHFAPGAPEFTGSDLFEIGGTGEEEASIELSFLASKAEYDILSQSDPTPWLVEVSLWREGSAWAERRILARGPMDNLSFGNFAEPITGIVEERFSDDRALLPDDAAVVTETTWPAPVVLPAVGQPATGSVYPIVFGAPGLALPSDDFGDLYGWPAFAVAFDGNGDNSATPCTVLLSDGLLSSIGAASIEVVNVSLDPTESTVVTPVAGVDGQGRTVTTVEIDAVDLPISAGDELWCIAQQVVGLQGAGDIIRWVLEQSSLRVDFASLDETLTTLNLFRLDGVINSQVSPYSFLVDEILPLLPVTLTRTSGGLSLRLWPWRAGAQDARTTIGPAYACQRMSTVDWSSTYDVKSAFQFSFGYDMRAGEYRRLLRYVPEPAYDTPTEIRNPWCVRADTRLNRRTGLRGNWRWETLESALVADPATARAILDWRARRYSQAVQSAKYAGPEELQYLRAGDVVWWADSEVNVDRLAWIREITYRPDHTELVVESLPAVPS
jgi:hypothetical protein